MANVNVKNYFSRVSPGFSRDNIFNLAREKWTIDGEIVSATAAQLNGLTPVFGKFKIIETLSAFPTPDEFGGIHLENQVEYLITEALDMGVNYFVMDADVACKLSTTPGAILTSETTGSLFRGSGFSTLFLEEVFVMVPNGQVFDLSGGVSMRSFIIGQAMRIGTISDGFVNGIDTLVFAGETFDEGLTLKDTSIVDIRQILCFTSQARVPLISLDGTFITVTIAKMSGFVGDSGAWLYIKPTCVIAGEIFINGNPYVYESGTFFWIGESGAIDTITDGGGPALVTTVNPHGLTGTFNLTIEGTDDYDNTSYTGTVASPTTFTFGPTWTADNAGGKWTAVGRGAITAFSAYGQSTLVTTSRNHQQSGAFSVQVSGDTVYAGAYTATPLSATSFIIPVLFTVNDAGGSTLWDIVSQANENPMIICKANGQLPDAPPSIQYVEVTCTAEQLAGDGQVTLVPSFSPRMKISLTDFRVSGGPNFSGGDRDLQVLGDTPSITTIDSAYLSAISGQSKAWGSTEVPFGTFVGSRDNIVAEYVGGAADYSSGSMKFYLSYAPQINKLGQ